MQPRIVNPDRPTADLAPVEHPIVRLGADAAGIAFQPVEVFVERRRKWMVHRIPAAVFLVVLEQRKLGDPEESVRVRRNEILLLRDHQPQLAQQLRRSVCRSRRHHQQIVSPRVRLRERTLQCCLVQALDGADRRVARTHPHQTGEAHLFGLIDECFDLAARVSIAARYGEPANDTAARHDLFEYPVIGVPEHIGHVGDRETEAQVRLVRSVPRDRFGVGHASNRHRHVAADLLEDLLHQGLDDTVNRVGPRKRHLDVDLRELELPIGALILVAEAAHDLEIAVHARDHQDLLEDLRRLRQRVELAGVHPARHEKVARAFRRGLRENRRLDFPEAVRVEVFPDGHRHPVAETDVVLEPRPPQVQVPVAEPDVLRDGAVLGDLERRRLRLVQDANLAREHLDLAGRQLRVHGLFRPPLHHTGHADHELGS